MTRTSAVALALLAGTCSAIAAEQELITFTAVPSRNLINDPANSIQTYTVTGNYPVGFINVSGTQSRIFSPADPTTPGALDSWFGEACILITPPSGRPFVVQPTPVVNPGSTVLTNTVTPWQSIPIDPIADANGTWTFQFFETDNDTNTTLAPDGTDSTWDSISFSMDDGTPTIPGLNVPTGVVVGASNTWTNIDSNGTLAASPTILTWSVPAGAPIIGLVVGGTVTPVTGSFLNQAGSLADDVIIRVVPPGQSITSASGAGFLPLFTGAAGTGSGSIIGQFSQTWPAEGDWSVVLYENTNSVDPINGDIVDNVWNKLQVSLLTSVPTPTTQANLGTLAANTTVSATVTVTAADVAAGNRIKWVRFTLPQTVGIWPNIRALSIDTEGSVTVGGSSASTPTRDTFSALFTAEGRRIGADFGDGSDSLATMTFGTDDRPGVPSNLPTGGSVGALLNGRDSENLPAGEYYIGVGIGGAGVGVSPGLFGVTTTENGTGTIQINVNYADPFVPTITTPPVADAAQSVSINDLGDVGTTTPDTEKVSSVTVDVAAGTSQTAPLNVDWVKFAIAQPTTANPSYYVDIDTFGGSFPAVGTLGENDTEISLWRNDGVIIARNDDFNDSTVLSGLSFGSSTIRDFPESGVGVFNGAQGSLPAGTYWIAAGPWNIISGMHTNADTNGAVLRTGSGFTDTRFRVNRSNFGGVNFNVPAGTIQVNVRTNIPKAPSCPNPSNVSGPGQNTTAIDAELTADDIIVFLNRFFAGNLLSDVSGPGQNTTAIDGELTADDIIVFLNRFFAGC
jgi:hypothetical protein